MSYEWSKDIKPTLKKGAHSYNIYGRALTPFFVGNVTGEMGEDIGNALQVSGVNVDPAMFKHTGTALGTIAPFVPGNSKVTGPLMGSYVTGSLLNRYNASPNLAEIAETLDLLGVNRNQDNRPFFDRFTEAFTNPNLLKDGYQFTRDFSPFSGILNIPAVQKYVDRGAANIISLASRPYFTSQGLNGYYLDAKEDVLPTLKNVPKYDWLWGTEDEWYKDGFIQSLNPLIWHEAFPEWWKSLTGGNNAS